MLLTAINGHADGHSSIEPPPSLVAFTIPPPFDVGSTCLCCLSHDDWRLAEIIEKRETRREDGDEEDDEKGAGPSSYEFYVHFKDLNRRLDRWVSERELRPAPLEPSPVLTALGTANGVGRPLVGAGAFSLPSLSPPSLPFFPPALLLPFSPVHQAPFSPMQPKFHPAFAHLAQSQPSSLSSPLPTPSASSPSTADRRLTRRERRLAAHSLDDPQLTYTDEGEVEIEKEHAEKTKVRNIQSIIIATPASTTPSRSASGEFTLPLSSAHQVDCWYYSPYPHPYRSASSLYLCGFCFSCWMEQQSLISHWLDECRLHHPPGVEIYRDAVQHGLSVWEVDGEKHRLFCQNLCLLSKLFIDHKTAIYDPELFLFYLLTVHQTNGHALVAYFSREKHSVEGNNVACILTFPQHQRRGYGRFLIALSYQLSVIEGRAGGPERPLSDLGRVSYRSWWSERLLELLSAYGEGAVCGVEELSGLSGMKREDIVRVLREHGLVRYVKGDHVVTVEGKKMDDWRNAMATERAKASEQGSGPVDSIQRPRCDFNPRLLQWKAPVFPRWTSQAARDRRGGRVASHSRQSSEESPGKTKRKREE